VRRVVFNADDLGLSRATNDGVIEVARGGLVREASLLVTGFAVPEAIAQLRQLEAPLGVGLHFSLTLGRALTGPLPGLTRSDGCFLPLPRVLSGCLRGIPEKDAVERELRAQLARLEELGIRATHLNAHHHVHVLPVVRDAVIAVVAEHPALHVRVPIESLHTSRRITLRRGLLAALSLAFVRRARRRLGQFDPTPLVGLDLAADHDHAAAFARLARRLAFPVAEWIVHPRSGDAVSRSPFALHGSARETATLVSSQTRALLEELGVVPSRYDELVATSS
jgi:predicted glycoside hydrolase/deacetylase ChbG (UPF0249 family)